MAGKAEIYVSTDIETDGPIPGPHSMLSLASAAFLPDKTVVSTFSANLNPLEGASGHPDTMAWWEKNPEAWAAARRDTRPPGEVMTEYATWVKALPGRPVFVAYPVGFDFTFVYWYLHRFTGGSPFSHSALDMKTLAMALMKAPYRDSTKRQMPRSWFPNRRHTHVALDDALEQGELFCNMLQELHG
jgi:DNA polymerase III alpha subunit (gram-positive type)